MKPSESHKQPTFVIPKISFRQEGFVDVIVCTVIIFTFEDIPLLIYIYYGSPLCNSYLGNKWVTSTNNSRAIFHIQRNQKKCKYELKMSKIHTHVMLKVLDD